MRPGPGTTAEDRAVFYTERAGLALSAPLSAAAGETPCGAARPFAAATTGPTNLVASAVFRHTRHLYDYLTGELARLPGVSAMQTGLIIRTLKRTGSVR